MGLKQVTAAPSGPAKALQPATGSALTISAVGSNEVLARVGTTNVLAGSSALRNDDWYDQITGIMGPRYRLLGLKVMSALAGGNAGMAEGDMHAQPFILPRGGTIDRISIQVLAVAGGVVRFGIYEAGSDTDLYPGALVPGSENDFVTDVAGRVDFAPAGGLTLTAGKVYFACYQRNAIAVAVKGMAAPSDCQAVGGFDPDLPATNAQILGLYVSRVFAAFPATFPGGASIWPSGFGAMPLAVFARMSS